MCVKSWRSTTNEFRCAAFGVGGETFTPVLPTRAGQDADVTRGRSRTAGRSAPRRPGSPSWRGARAVPPGGGDRHVRRPRRGSPQRRSQRRQAVRLQLRHLVQDYWDPKHHVLEERVRLKIWIVGARQERLGVRARAERIGPRTRHDDDTDRTVDRESLHDVEHLPGHQARHAVSRVGTIDGDRRYASRHLDPSRLVLAHTGPPRNATEKSPDQIYDSGVLSVVCSVLGPLSQDTVERPHRAPGATAGGVGDLPARRRRARNAGSARSAGHGQSRARPGSPLTRQHPRSS
jgi:hypothetical protein